MTDTIKVTIEGEDAGDCAVVASHLGERLQDDGYPYEIFVGEDLIQRHPGTKARNAYRALGKEDRRPKVTIKVME